MRYEKYSPSIIRWNHQFPSHWRCEKAKRFFSNPKRLNKENGERNILSLTLRGVIRNDGDKPIGLSPSDYSTYQIFYPGELVFKLIDLNNISTSRVGLVPEKGIMSSAYIRFAPREDMNIKYFYYQYFDWYKRNIFNGLGEGVRLTLSGTDLMNLEILVPPRPEQDQIVRYLDWQVSKINKLIAAKKKQIISLTAKKQIMVSDVITHGLNPKAKMKFSGVKWLGDIPTHWTVVKLRGILSAVSEKGHPEMQLLSIVREQGVIVRNVEDSESNHNFIPDDLSGYKVVRKNQFAMNKMKAWQGSYGISQYDGIVSPAYFVFNVNFKNLEYFNHAIRSRVYVNFFAQASDGIRVGQWDLSMNKMKDIPFILPPENEQAEIVHYIPAQIEIIEKAISAIQSQINKLHELRTRLISDVVTGQMDVRGIEVPDFTLVEETDESVDEDENPEESEEQEDE